MKKILLLIGQKGSGKSFIGSLLDEIFDIKFVRVEDWVKNIKRERKISDESYHIEVFEAIEAGIINELKFNDNVCFESLGLSSHFDKMVENLKRNFELITIKVKCEPGLCLKRIRQRDQKVHVNISDDEIVKLNEMVLQRNYQTNYSILNNSSGRENLVEELRTILIKSGILEEK